MSTYRDLEIWHESVSLIKVVYEVAEKLPRSEEYNLKSQVKRAVTSVAINIAEGKGRKTAKDFANFLTIAVASLSEVEAILAVCEELEMIKVEKKVTERIEMLGKRIHALRNKLLGGN